jgi:hypothetical protein
MSKRRLFYICICGVILAATLLSGCTLFNTSVVTDPDTQSLASPTSEIVVTDTVSPLPSETDTVSPAPTDTDTATAPTETSGALCTVLSDVNFRSGPGTPYRPPIRALAAGTELVPLGFNSVGIIGGPWVHVRDESRNEIGWVSGETRLLSCNIDLNELPQVSVPPPPPPPAPVVTDTGPDGGEQPDSWVWELDFNPEYFLRMRVFDQESGENRDGSGINNVTFTVFDADGTEIYKRTENTAAYCAFGGGEPDCNPWIIENYAYRWTNGAEAAKSGLYTIIIEVNGSIEDDFGDLKTGLWNLRDVSIEFP